MATIINNPDTTERNGGSAGLIVAVLVAIVIVALLLVYGLPGRGEDTGSQGGNNINVPERVQVDVNSQGN